MAKKESLCGPTTVRFPGKLDAWIKQRAAKHPDGAAGVIRDACAAAMKNDQLKDDRLYKSLIGVVE